MAGVLAGLKVSMSVSLRYHQGRKQHAVELGKKKQSLQAAPKKSSKG